MPLLQNGGESLSEIESARRSAAAGPRSGPITTATASPICCWPRPPGPKLYTNLGNGAFRDDSHLLPREPGYNLTAAAWIDYDGDGRPDILLGNGYHGLRLYRNKGPVDTGKAPLVLGKWHYIGPFPNDNNQGFNTAYPPEKEINLKAKYPGRGGNRSSWKEGKFTDGEINNLALFEPQTQRQCRRLPLPRDRMCTKPLELPVSLGSDDTLTVWLNGQKIIAENVLRAAALPIRTRLTLKLKAGKNQLLMKICQGSGDWAFYFKAQATCRTPSPGRSRTSPTRSASAATASAAPSRATR